jgi:DNA-binding response OmpR family regulator
MNGDRKTVLIVDDDPDIRLFIQFNLRKAGFEILQAANGAKALAVIGERKPDLIITDVMMPVLDGYGLIEAVRKDAGFSRIPILMLTGRDDEKAVEGTAQPDGYMKKPVASAEIIQQVQELLSKIQ